jgi:hypothetical protein
MSQVIEILISDPLSERIDFFSHKYHMARSAMATKLLADAIKFESRKHALEKYSEGKSINESASEARIEPGELISILDKSALFLGFQDSERKLF